MTITYCPNGHPQDQPYALYDRDGNRGPYCGVCRAPLVRVYEPEPSSLWMVAAIVGGAFAAVVLFWMWWLL